MLLFKLAVTINSVLIYELSNKGLSYGGVLEGINALHKAMGKALEQLKSPHAFGS